MTVVLDTNVLVAAFAARGLCQSVFELCLDRHAMALSERLLQELTASLKTKLKLPAPTVAEVETYVRSVGMLTDPPPLPAPVCRDPEDDHVLALAVAAAAQVIVTGDKDLLELGKHGDTEVLNQRSFWDRQRTA